MPTPGLDWDAVLAAATEPDRDALSRLRSSCPAPVTLHAVDGFVVPDAPMAFRARHARAWLDAVALLDLHQEAARRCLLPRLA